MKFLKLPDSRYVEWSSSWDAPISYSMSQEEFEGWHRDEFGRRAHAEYFASAIQNCEDHGCSSRHETAEILTDGNRAGEDESEITLVQIAERYHPSKKVFEEDEGQAAPSTMAT